MRMRIVIFGGTTEGRTLSRLLAERGAEVQVCVATDYGREEQGDAEGVRVLAGRKDQREMENLLRGAFLCVDATHPYAAEVTRNLRAACQSAGVPYRRLLRRESCLNGLEPIRVESAAEATFATVRSTTLVNSSNAMIRFFPSGSRASCG